MAYASFQVPGVSDWIYNLSMKQNNVLEKAVSRGLGFTETRALSEPLWGSRGRGLALSPCMAASSGQDPEALGCKAPVGRLEHIKQLEVVWFE